MLANRPDGGDGPGYRETNRMTEASGPPRIGSELRDARERLGWSLPDVAAELRIRRPYLEALEDGRVRDLPGQAYAVGFLRTYSVALGLESEDMVRRMKIEAASVHSTKDLRFPAPVPERGLPTGAILLIGIVLAIGVYVGYYKLSGDGRLPPEAVLPVPQHLTPLAEQVVPPAPAPVPAPAQTATLTPPSGATGVTAPDMSEPPSFGSVPPSSAAAMPLPQAQRAQIAQTATPSPASPLTTTLAGSPGAAQAAALPTAAQAGAGDGAPNAFVLRANADAWVQVREKGGKILLNRILRPGETWPVPDDAATRLLLTTGNAGGTELLVGGKLAPSLGNAGVVRRDLPLDPERAMAGTLSPLTAH